MAELYYPELLRNKEAFPANIFFTFYERNSTKESEIKDQIHLYMPEQFGQPNTITWDSNFRGGQQLLGGIGSLMGAMGGIFSKLGMNKMGAGATRSGQQMKELSSNGLPAQDLAELKSGVMLNPYLSQLFRGVDFRNFQYTFRFVPFTPADCDNIKEIITVFRKWSLPSGPAGGRSIVLLEISWRG